MNIKVMYQTRTGNTKKIAEAIAKEVNVQAEIINEGTKLSNPVDLLFIGGGIYWWNMDKKVKNFIETLDSSKVKNAVVFGTIGGLDKAIIAMQDLLRSKGINVINESFYCKGNAWVVINKGLPNTSDEQNAKAFAKKVVQSI